MGVDMTAKIKGYLAWGHDEARRHWRYEALCECGGSWNTSASYWAWLSEEVQRHAKRHRASYCTRPSHADHPVPACGTPGAGPCNGLPRPGDADGGGTVPSSASTASGTPEDAGYACSCSVNKPDVLCRYCSEFVHAYTDPRLIGDEPNRENWCRSVSRRIMKTITAWSTAPQPRH